MISAPGGGVGGGGGSLINSLEHIPALCWVLFLDEGGIADLHTEIKIDSLLYKSIWWSRRPKQDTGWIGRRATALMVLMYLWSNSANPWQKIRLFYYIMKPDCSRCKCQVVFCHEGQPMWPCIRFSPCSGHRLAEVGDLESHDLTRVSRKYEDLRLAGQTLMQHLTWLGIDDLSLDSEDLKGFSFAFAYWEFTFGFCTKFSGAHLRI